MDIMLFRQCHFCAQDNDLVTTYSYNIFGELTGIDYSDSTPDITYSYNRVGKLAQVTDVVGTRTFAYNDTLDEGSESITGLYSKTLTRTYMSTGFKGRRQGLSIDNVSHYAYDYDQYGRMNQITIPSGSFNYTRLANSDLVSQMTRPNGITTIWSYETDRDLITQVQNGTASTYGYVNDAIGRRTSMSRSGIAYPTPDVISYTYNDRSELTGVSSNVDTTYSYSYAYDPIGNRITASEAGVPWSYATNSLNQYTSATENNTQLSFAYDLDGSMTYRPVDTTGGWMQIWNGENRMVETYKGTDRLTFKYDYMGRRVEKCVYSGNTLTSKTLFVYDGFKCVEELDALDNNAVLMRHAWQPFDLGLDIILATTDGGGTFLFLHDANKNVMQKINASSVILANYAYAPFGENIGTAIAIVGFSSEILDFELSLNYYIFRSYNYILGKWSSRDPEEENGGFNLYGFLINSITNKIDFLGLNENIGKVNLNAKNNNFSNSKSERFNKTIIIIPPSSLPPSPPMPSSISIGIGGGIRLIDLLIPAVIERKNQKHRFDAQKECILKTLSGNKPCCCIKSYIYERIDFGLDLIVSHSTYVHKEPCSNYNYSGSILKPHQWSIEELYEGRCCY